MKLFIWKKCLCFPQKYKHRNTDWGGERVAPISTLSSTTDISVTDPSLQRNSGGYHSANVSTSWFSRAFVLKDILIIPLWQLSVDNFLYFIKSSSFQVLSYENIRKTEHTLLCTGKKWKVRRCLRYEEILRVDLIIYFSWFLKPPIIPQSFFPFPSSVCMQWNFVGC